MNFKIVWQVFTIPFLDIGMRVNDSYNDHQALLDQYLGHALDPLDLAPAVRFRMTEIGAKGRTHAVTIKQDDFRYEWLYAPVNALAQRRLSSTGQSSDPIRVCIA